MSISPISRISFWFAVVDTTIIPLPTLADFLCHSPLFATFWFIIACQNSTEVRISKAYQSADVLIHFRFQALALVHQGLGGS